MLIQLSTYELQLKPSLLRSYAGQHAWTYRVCVCVSGQTLRVPHNSQELIFMSSISRIMLSCFIQSINHGRTLSPLLGGRGGGKHSREQKPEQRLNMKGDTKEVLISIHITRTRLEQQDRLLWLFDASFNSAVRTHVYVMLCLDALSPRSQGCQLTSTLM